MTAPCARLLIATVLAVALVSARAAGIRADDGDNDVRAKLAALDAQLEKLTFSAQEDGRFALWQFGRSIQGTALSPAQETKILSHLDDVARRTPAARKAVEGARFMVGNLRVGKMAPEIAGVDLDGKPMRLSDFRGKVVLLMFSGDWCGICRAQYPYERFMLDLYKNWPFDIVAVESGDDQAAAKASMKNAGLTYRAFWDGGADAKNGPIAKRWNVVGWPATYVIDGGGVIQAVDVIQEDLLKSVRLTLAAEPARAAAAAKTKTGPKARSRSDN